MCRLLCYMGDAIPMEVLLTKPEHSLVSQSRDASFHPGCLDKINIRVNCDGFGVAWYNPAKVEEGACVVKFPTPAWSSPNLFNIAKFVESGLMFAHVRAAFDGAALTGNVNHENTHPFKYKRYTFMHNGGIPGFGKMKRQLMSLLGDEAFEAIEGTTDSELCFALFLDELPSTEAQLSAAEISQVLRRTIARLVAAVALYSQEQNPGFSESAHAADSRRQRSACRATYRAGANAFSPSCEGRYAVPPMSLNFCVTDGQHMVCSRYRNHARQDPPSMFLLSGAGFAGDTDGRCLRLRGTEPLTSVVISSEPLCKSTKTWQLVPRNSMVVVEGAAPARSLSSGAVASRASVRQGLVASIKFESLRCHPSDASDSEGPIAPMASSPNDARVVYSEHAAHSADTENGSGVTQKGDTQAFERVRTRLPSSAAA